MTTRKTMATTEAACVPKYPIAAVPREAAAKEITKVMIEIHKFTKTLTLVPCKL